MWFSSPLFPSYGKLGKHVFQIHTARWKKAALITVDLMSTRNQLLRAIFWFGRLHLLQQHSRAKATRVLPRECTGYSKHPLPTTQAKTLHMDIIRWLTPKSDWLYFCSQRWRSSIQSRKTRLGADRGSDHELLIAKFRLKLKKVGKTIRLFRYDLNQIPYDYTVEVRNRFKGLDLIDRGPDELWTEVRGIVQETGIKTIP